MGNTSPAVRNSKDFVSFIQQVSLDPSEILVSFDVVSLFTRIPIKLALEVARKRLKDDESLSL